MQRQVRRAVARLDGTAERMIVGHRACDGVAVERGCGRKRDVTQPRLDAEPAMHPHGIGALLDAGADTGEGLRLLVDLDVDPGAAERSRRRKAADARADDGDLCLAQCSHGPWTGGSSFTLLCARAATSSACRSR